VVEELGISDYLAEIGGEVAARGAKPNGNHWRIGVENPIDTGPMPALELPADMPSAVVTSGTYRQHFAENGREFAHIIDPRTGRPVQHNLVAVTVVDTDATRAAAWATALLCLGPEAAEHTADRMRVAALMWVRAGGELEVRHTAELDASWKELLD
jgi:thiamine biosynthesis lipoprotein